MNVNKLSFDLKTRILLFLLSLFGIALSLYLTFHFYQVHFPKGPTEDSLCNISGFFNCDAASFSPLASFFGVPLGAFGLVFSLVIFFGAFVAQKNIHRFNYLVSLLNLLGCIFLLVYSLVALRSLCPGCAGYYVCSLLIFLLYAAEFKQSFLFSFQTLGIYAALGAVVIGLFGYKTYNENKLMATRFADVFEYYKDAKSFESLNLHSEFTSLDDPKEFYKRPLRIQIFTDFECGFCEDFSRSVLKPLMKKYDKVLGVQFFFWPLDNACNKNLSAPMHPSGCLAAKYAICKPNEFNKVYDELYKNIFTLAPYLKENINNDQIRSCINSEESEKILQEMITAGEKIDLRGTPSILLNGKKIGSGIPLKYLILLVDSILEGESTN